MSTAPVTGFSVCVAHEMCGVCCYGNVLNWGEGGRKERGGMAGFRTCGPEGDWKSGEEAKTLWKLHCLIETIQKRVFQ